MQRFSQAWMFTSDREPDGRKLQSILAEYQDRLALALTQAAHAERERRHWAAITEASKDAIWSWTPDGSILSWNVAAERLFGYSADEMVGKSLLRLVPEDRMATAQNALADLRGGKWYGQYETVRLTKDGRAVDVELTVSPIRDEAGAILGGSTFCRDITQRKLLQANSERRMRELAALYHFTERLHVAGSLADVYEAALDAILRAVGCPRASILLFDAGNVMRFVAWRGLSSEYRKAVDGHSPWTADAVDPQPVWMNDLSTVDIPGGLRRVIESEGIVALGFVPLVADGRLIGKFMTYYDEPHTFDEDEQHLALTAARQVALGIERQRAVEIEKTLTRELQHRSNNLLAVVQAIVHRSLAGADSLDAAKRVLGSRLQALARAHQRLTHAQWAGVDLGEIVRSELEPFAGRARIDGSAIMLSPNHAQSFSLAVHELATNAAKYGALSNPEGHVDVSWRLSGVAQGESLQFRWCEQGGPPVKTPTRQGFGTSLLRATFGNVRFEYPSQGLICRIDVPLAGRR
jgi:PAS domain S-box-containing protein